MKNIDIILVFVMLMIIASCKKEEPDPRPIIPVEEPTLYVPIFESGDTSKGAAYSNKLTSKWSASVFCRTAFLDSTKLALQLFTYTANGSLREHLVLGAVPKIGGIGQYNFAADYYSAVPPGEVYTSYSTWSSDGDVTEDGYQVDTTDLKNQLVITKIDLSNKRVEGTFHVSYNIREPRFNPANPKKVTFSAGRFWATIRD